MPRRFIEGLGRDRGTSINHSRLHITSDGTLVIVSEIQYPPDSVWYRNPRLAYARYDAEGELVDSFRIIDEEQDEHFNACFWTALDLGDSLHVAYQENNDDGIRVRYFKIGPDGEFVVRNATIEGIEGEPSIVARWFAIDDEGRPCFLFVDNWRESIWCARYDYRLELDFLIRLGRHITGSSSTFTFDLQGNCHIAGDFRDERISPRDALGYICLSPDGEIIDSLQFIHDANAGNRGENGNWASWSNQRLLIDDSGRIAIIWSDYRHGDSELYMRHSALPEGIKETRPVVPFGFLSIENYPNPFNSGTTFLILGTTLNVTLEINITDFQGRLVFARSVIPASIGSTAFYWPAHDQSSVPLPTGCYSIVAIQSNHRASRIITIIK